MHQKKISHKRQSAHIKRNPIRESQESIIEVLLFFFPPKVHIQITIVKHINKQFPPRYMSNPIRGLEKLSSISNRNLSPQERQKLEADAKRVENGEAGNAAYMRMALRVV